MSDKNQSFPLSSYSLVLLLLLLLLPTLGPLFDNEDGGECELSVRANNPTFTFGELDIECSRGWIMASEQPLCRLRSSDCVDHPMKESTWCEIVNRRKRKRTTTANFTIVVASLLSSSSSSSLMLMWLPLGSDLRFGVDVITIFRGFGVVFGVGGSVIPNASPMTCRSRHQEGNEIPRRQNRQPCQCRQGRGPCGAGKHQVRQWTHRNEDFDRSHRRLREGFWSAVSLSPSSSSFPIKTTSSHHPRRRRLFHHERRCQLRR